MARHRIACIGTGQMATALARGLVAARFCAADEISAYDVVEKARLQFADAVPGVQLKESNRDAVAAADLVLLAVKPHQLQAVADEVRNLIGDKHLLVSIAAGVTISQLAQWYGTERVIRVMPNTPCLVGQGASAFAPGRSATHEDAEIVDRMLSSVGLVYQVDEPLLDSVTGLSGSGPAYIYVLIEALSDGGVRVGLPRAMATRLAAQTVRGAAEMVLAGDDHPGVLKDRVTSPGGTTIAAIQALEEHGFRAAAISAVVASTGKAREMGR